MRIEATRHHPQAGPEQKFSQVLCRRHPSPCNTRGLGPAIYAAGSDAPADELSSAPMQKALDDLVGLLDLETLEVNVFRGQSPQDGSQRVFGGQVMGQAMVAAGRTFSTGRLFTRDGRLVASMVQEGLIRLTPNG